MTKKKSHTKNLITYKLEDLTEPQAKEKGQILFKAWQEVKEKKKIKNRKKIERNLDKLRKK